MQCDELPGEKASNNQLGPTAAITKGANTGLPLGKTLHYYYFLDINSYSVTKRVRDRAKQPHAAWCYMEKPNHMQRHHNLSYF